MNSQTYKKFAKNQAKGCDLAIQKMQSPDTVKITHIGANVNAPYTEFAPIPLGDSVLLFASLKSDTIIMVDEIKKNNAYASFYASRKTVNHLKRQQFMKEHLLIQIMHTPVMVVFPRQKAILFYPVRNAH